jgi:hypothetical protein
LPAGFECLNPTQYALDFYGPFGGSIDRWRTLGNQDYDARVTQQAGAGVITLEGFEDAYNYNEQKGPQTVTPDDPNALYGPGPNYLYLFHNRGYLLSDDFALSKNDFGFGYTWLNQQNTNGQSVANAAGTAIAGFQNNPPLFLSTASYFVRDTWTPNSKLSLFGTAWIQRSLDTSTTNFDPRVSVVYRPDPSDVVRLTGGRSYSEPDPSLIAAAPPILGAPSSVNCPESTTGPGSITSIASTNNPDLHPETAEDLEFAYGHRFTMTTNVQADVYQSWENGALLSGNVPISSVPGVTVPQYYINEVIDRLKLCPGLNPGLQNLAFTTTYNASGARYRGIVLSAQTQVVRNVTFNTSFDVQSAAYVGVAQDILQANTNLIDGGQIYGIPLRQGTAGLAYQGGDGLAARLDATYIGGNNSWNRNPFWFANASISKTTGQVTVGFGIYNLFNSVAQQYGYIGNGVYIPQNYYGLGQASGLTQSNEEFGLPFRQFWLTAKVGI